MQNDWINTNDSDNWNDYRKSDRKAKAKKNLRERRKEKVKQKYNGCNWEI